jgi:hypothetical protein
VSAEGLFDQAAQAAVVRVVVVEHIVGEHPQDARQQPEDSDEEGFSHLLRLHDEGLIVFQDLAGRLVGRCHPGLAQQRQPGLEHRARFAQAGVRRERVPRKGLGSEVDLLHLAGHRKTPKEEKGAVSSCPRV